VRDRPQLQGKATMSESEIKKPFDPFELAAAILLGLAAVGASVAGYQSGLWGGQSVEGYGESAAMTTKAGSMYNDELTSYIQDAQTDTRAKELVWEALEIDDEDRATRMKQMASWMYSTQLSEPAYAALKLPELPEDANTEDVFSFTDDELSVALNTDLDDDYVDELFSQSSVDFEAAEKRFETARAANEAGDKFSLAGVILTVALFFGGLALVFKTRIRWGFLGTGVIVFLVGAGYMGMLTWA
jgi:hypothetical protein